MILSLWKKLARSISAVTEAAEPIIARADPAAGWPLQLCVFWEGV